MGGKRHMGGERAHGRREGTWEERGHMGGERTHGRREGTWEERGLLHLLFFLIIAKSS